MTALLVGVGVAVLTAVAVSWAVYIFGPQGLFKRVRGVGSALRQFDASRVRLRLPFYLSQPPAPNTPQAPVRPPPLEVTSDGMVWRFNRTSYMARPVQAFCPDDDVELRGRDRWGDFGTLGQHVVGEGGKYYETPCCPVCQKEFSLTSSPHLEEAFVTAEALLSREVRRRRSS